MLKQPVTSSGAPLGRRMLASETVRSLDRQQSLTLAYHASIAKCFASKAAVENANLGVQGRFHQTAGIDPQSLVASVSTRRCQWKNFTVTRRSSSSVRCLVLMREQKADRQTRGHLKFSVSSSLAIFHLCTPHKVNMIDGMHVRCFVTSSPPPLQQRTYSIVMHHFVHICCADDVAGTPMLAIGHCATGLACRANELDHCNVVHTI